MSAQVNLSGSHSLFKFAFAVHVETTHALTLPRKGTVVVSGFHPLF
jgi:hypothetical protein